MAQVRWLGAVRHAESMGNRAADHAERSGAEQLDLATRDPDVPLSDRGELQAAALRTWLKESPVQPGVLLASPYVRTAETARRATEGLGLALAFDERLRDRELGVLDLLTTAGVMARFPDEAERRRRLGKFYYRPPGGESWADVALRVRALLGDLSRDHTGEAVLLFTHDVVVQMIRYVVEDLTEADVVRSAHESPIANASVSSWILGADGRLHGEIFNDVRHLLAEGAPPTHEEGVRDEPL
jgi:probable phosphoglycerate mutase